MDKLVVLGWIATIGSLLLGKMVWSAYQLNKKKQAIIVRLEEQLKNLRNERFQEKRAVNMVTLSESIKGSAATLLTSDEMAIQSVRKSDSSTKTSEL